MAIIALVCVLTFLHYVGAQMRGPVLSLYAAAHGATPTGVGLIIGAHMLAAAVGSIPLGRASDIWGRRPLMLAAMALSVATSLLLPLFESEYALVAIYGLAGLGVAAFTPSALSLVGDAAPPSKIGHAYAWYSTAHYGAIAIGPFLGGVLAEWWGYRAAFVGSAVGIGIALGVGLAIPVRRKAPTSERPGATFADVRNDPGIWAGWIVAVSGLLIQGCGVHVLSSARSRTGLDACRHRARFPRPRACEHARARAGGLARGSQRALSTLCDQWHPRSVARRRVAVLEKPHLVVEERSHSVRTSQRK